MNVKKYIAHAEPEMSEFVLLCCDGILTSSNGANDILIKFKNI